MTPDGAWVLLVDDADNTLELYSDALSQKGLNVATPSSRAQALKTALTLVPQAIVLDISLPDMDGIEVCRRLKAEEQTRQIPVIVLSAFSDARTRERARDAGAAFYLVKPRLPATLLSIQVERRLQRAGRSCGCL